MPPERVRHAHGVPRATTHDQQRIQRSQAEKIYQSHPYILKNGRSLNREHPSLQQVTSGVLSKNLADVTAEKYSRGSSPRGVTNTNTNYVLPADAFHSRRSTETLGALVARTSSALDGNTSLMFPWSSTQLSAMRSRHRKVNLREQGSKSVPDGQAVFGHGADIFGIYEDWKPPTDTAYQLPLYPDSGLGSLEVPLVTSPLYPGLRLGCARQCHKDRVQCDFRPLQCLVPSTECSKHSDLQLHYQQVLHRQASCFQPNNLVAAEHLIHEMLLENRSGDALAILHHVCLAFQVDRSQHQISSDPSKASTHSAENGRILDLPKVELIMRFLFMKGNILYNARNYHDAFATFEEIILLATQCCPTLAAFIRLVLEAISPDTPSGTQRHGHQTQSKIVLLPPESALFTSKLCFPPDGIMPGLRSIRSQASRDATILIVSNSVLSLAKILQENVAKPARACVKENGLYQTRDILALYYLSFSLQPSPSIANNIGILLASVPQLVSDQDRGLGHVYLPGVVPNSGTTFALLYYQYGLKLDPNHPHLYTNLGTLLKDIGQVGAAVRMYEMAVKYDSNFVIALANLANALRDQGRTGDAICYYQRAVHINPRFSEAICGLANAFNSICRWAGRGGVLSKCGRFDRWHVDKDGALVDARRSDERGSGWTQSVLSILDAQLCEGDIWGTGVMGHTSAVRHFIRQLIHHMPETTEQVTTEHERLAIALKTAIRSWLGQPHEGARLVRLVERATRSVCQQWYRDKYIMQNERSLDTYSRPQLPEALAPLNVPIVLPFHTFTLPVTARQVRMLSQRNALRVSITTLQSPWLPRTVFPPPPPPSPCLNIGYLSSDFNNHPLSHLMQSVFGFHDRERVRAICYATTPSDASTYRLKIEGEAALFRDVSGYSVSQIVEQILHDQIHILINLNGYTRGARNEVFAARPAPVQMSFMGFAGTLGAEWCDYMLADDIAIPKRTLRPWRRNVDLLDMINASNSTAAEDEWVYGENIIYTQGSFFCCDHRQSGYALGEHHLTWEEELTRRWKMRKEIFPTLADDANIFGNFNQLYKIDPTTFRTWLRILSRVPNAVLWLLRFPDLGEPQLRATAQAWAGPDVASRIVFTDVAPKAIHIARACVIDLFLDTPECNAHTTAADCLWSGTPLLTLPRYEWKMASRMAAGILGGALDRGTEEGMRAWRELVVDSEEAYEETAVRLGRGLCYIKNGHGRATGRLVQLRKLTWSGRWRDGGLFDTRRWVREVEDAYEEAWRRWVCGQGGDIYLADLCGNGRS